MNRTVMIVGGVAAGASAATRARRLDPHAKIIIFERGGYVSFANCGLPYYVGDIIKDRNKLLVQTPEMFKRRFDIEVRVRHCVESIDRANKRIAVKCLDSGKSSRESYDRLILAPGATPIIPPFTGVDSANVFPLRSMEDTDAFRAYLDGHGVHRAAIVGAGFIGLEGAEALAHRGISIDVIERASQVLTPLDADMAAIVAAHLRDKGVSLHLDNGVEGLVVENERVVGVELAQGGTIDTGLVLMSVGVRPNTELAKNAGLELGPSGAIRVNEGMETSDPSILAAGDAVEVTHSVTGRPVLIPLAGPANKHGRLAGEIAVTDEGPPAPKVAGTAIVKVFDQTVALTGLSRKAAQHAGIAADHVMIKRENHATYYPGAEMMTIKLVYEPGSRRVLGAQIVGGAGVDRRIDIVATAIHFGGTVDDLAALDLAYAPQYGAAKDPIHIAAFVAGNQDRGLVRHVAPEEVPSLVNSGYQIVDVRSAKEFAAGSIEGAINISVDDIRADSARLAGDRPILVYCQAGQRGYYAFRALHGLGRDDVVNLAGGYAAYKIHQTAG
ncbi:MAG: FAD-dependent oxidoreductase [Planctomycetota bacterium]|jgi:NADPH-dependent 2,4-dienoyl-CoA reductase/sulfur reductase-like enzyme/rhodanese-related sulfurtransferase